MMLIYNVLVNIDVYCSLAKEHPWAEHLTSPPKRGVPVDVLSQVMFTATLYRALKK